MQHRPLQNPALAEFVRSVEASNRNEQLAIVLIGSAARGANGDKSDLDILVVGERTLSVPRFHPYPLHVQAIPKCKFLRRLESGDDFVAWSLRFGIPIRGSKYWQAIKNSTAAQVWPDWRRKLRHASLKLVIARSLLETGDIPSAAEETLYATGHAARALLLKEQAFPLSRPEMVEQLRRIGWPDLARVLDSLIADQADRRLISRTQRYLKRLLVSLDRPFYSEFVSVRRRVAEQKNILAIDPLARPALAGHMGLLPRLRQLVDELAKNNGIDLRGVEIRPAWSHEDDDRSRVVMDIRVSAKPEQRFTYWDALSDRVESFAESLSRHEKDFINSSMSIFVSPPYVV